MTRDKRLLGERTFHLRQGSGLSGWVAFEVWAGQSPDRIRVFFKTSGPVDLAVLRQANPEVTELFEMLDLEEMMSNTTLMREVLAGRKPVGEGSVGASTLPVVQAFLSDMRKRVRSLVDEAIPGLSASLHPGIGLAEGWDKTLATRIRREVESVVSSAVTEDVVIAWANRRLMELLPVLNIREAYVALPPGRGDWHVGVEVLSAMRDAGLEVTEVLPRTGTSYQDSIVLRIASANGSQDIEMDCPKGHPRPAVRWAAAIHSAYRGPERDLDESKALVRRAMASFDPEATEDDVNAQAEAGLAYHRDRRAMLVGLIGEDGLAAVLAVAAGDDEEVVETASPGAR